MKALIFITSILLAACLSISAQGLIAVQNGGAPSFYTQLSDAITNALDGDTIYLPAGGFPSLTINKMLHIIGTGYNPDSTAATGQTTIANIILENGASNGSVIGVYLQTYISISGNISNYLISRCLISGINTGSNGVFSNGVLRENMIINGNLILNASSIGNLISNNIFFGQIDITGCIARNNVFLYNNQFPNIYPTLRSLNCIVENNIFNSNSEGPYSYYGIFRNNINCSIQGIDSRGNQGTNNYYAGLLSEVFINYPGEGLFSSSNPPNFHLPPGSPYINAGTDGTDIGIYGGLFPWKDGGIPFNPRILFKNIANTTDQNGNLLINIKVEAQRN